MTSSTPCAGLWVGAIVHPRKVLEVQVGVNLRRRYVGMTQQFLHRAQVAGRFQQMRGETVAKHMRVNASRQARVPGPVVEPRLDAAGADSPAPHTHEQCVLPSAANSPRRRSQAFSASIALRPTGRMRVLPPLPVTRIWPSRMSTPPRSRPASSASRNPEE